MRALAALLACLALVACAAGTPGRTQRYDFGVAALPKEAAASHAAAPLKATLRVARMEAPPWLQGRRLYYELAYAKPPRIAAYAYSEWIGPAPRLLERLLRGRLDASGTWRSVIAADVDAPADAVLELRLLALRQVFTSATSSYAEIRIGATLVDAGGAGTIAQRELQVRAVAPSPDAAGGVTAFRRAAGQLSTELNRWLVRAAHSRFGASGERRE